MLPLIGGVALVWGGRRPVRPWALPFSFAFIHFLTTYPWSPRALCMSRRGGLGCPRPAPAVRAPGCHTVPEPLPVPRSRRPPGPGGRDEQVAERPAPAPEPGVGVGAGCVPRRKCPRVSVFLTVPPNQPDPLLRWAATRRTERAVTGAVPFPLSAQALCCKWGEGGFSPWKRGAGQGATLREGKAADQAAGTLSLRVRGCGFARLSRAPRHGRGGLGGGGGRASGAHRHHGEPLGPALGQLL